MRGAIPWAIAIALLAGVAVAVSTALQPETPPPAAGHAAPRPESPSPVRDVAEAVVPVLAHDGRTGALVLTRERVLLVEDATQGERARAVPAPPVRATSAARTADGVWIAGADDEGRPGLARLDEDAWRGVAFPAPAPTPSARWSMLPTADGLVLVYSPTAALDERVHVAMRDAAADAWTVVEAGPGRFVDAAIEGDTLFILLVRTDGTYVAAHSLPQGHAEAAERVLPGQLGWGTRISVDDGRIAVFLAEPDAETGLDPLDGQAASRVAVRENGHWTMHGTGIRLQGGHVDLRAGPTVGVLLPDRDGSGQNRYVALVLNEDGSWRREATATGWRWNPWFLDGSSRLVVPLPPEASEGLFRLVEVR